MKNQVGNAADFLIKMCSTKDEARIIETAYLITSLNTRNDESSLQCLDKMFRQNKECK